MGRDAVKFLDRVRILDLSRIMRRQVNRTHPYTTSHSNGQVMKYRFLGKTGLKVSELCLGRMTFGREATEEVSREILDRFVEVGGNFIDTADVYSLGMSEEIVGRWLKNKVNPIQPRGSHEALGCGLLR
jgi:hypothetical protein